MLLEGKRIIVTGGLTGIGKATVLAMAREGAQVVSMSRAEPTEERGAAVVDAAHKLGKGPVTHVQCDVTKRNVVNAAFAEAISLMGGLDALVNSAGLEHQGPAEDLTEEALVRAICSTRLMSAPSWPPPPRNRAASSCQVEADAPR